MATLRVDFLAARRLLAHRLFFTPPWSAVARRARGAGGLAPDRPASLTSAAASAPRPPRDAGGRSIPLFFEIAQIFFEIEKCVSTVLRCAFNRWKYIYRPYIPRDASSFVFLREFLTQQQAHPPPAPAGACGCPPRRVPPRSPLRSRGGGGPLRHDARHGQTRRTRRAQPRTSSAGQRRRVRGRRDSRRPRSSPPLRVSLATSPTNRLPTRRRTNARA